MVEKRVKKGTTVYIQPETLKELQDLDLSVMWKKLNFMSDKIQFLIYNFKNK